MNEFTAGTLVRARGREWVVLPDSDPGFLVLRPMGGSESEDACVLTAREPVELARFPRPSPDDAGDSVSAGLLRTALRVGFRATGGPFRSLAGIAVEPRPYQLVPLLMALRQDVVRLLIADDVGIGKTVEAGLVAAELLAQGSARRLTVLCAPALAEQWQRELSEKFRIGAELVLRSTAARLERGLLDDQSIFDAYPYTVVSTDFIKSPKRRDDFVRACPDLVIVDEAHTCVADGSSHASSRTLRYDLLTRLAADPGRNLLLVTATPHSGKDEGFRNLIGLLDPELATVDLTTRGGRDRLARHMVQRRRGDVRKYLVNTPFPTERQTTERSYTLTDEYRKLFDAVLAFTRETVRDASGSKVQQRVRYWSALALLRALASSPMAAAATLETRAATAGAETAEQADEQGKQAVLDLSDDESVETVDVAPGADEAPEGDNPERRRLKDFARRARRLAGPEHDAKLKLVGEAVQTLLADGYDPVVFCRFIDTAEYVAGHLTKKLAGTSDVACVTGTLPPDEREARIAELTATDRRHVLVATDCLSEGVNLQQSFQAVVHYDLAWNPTRHEQREGRVDRFGQERDVVRAVTIIGADNGVDETVMRVLLRKHDEIRKQLGVSIPVPGNANDVVEAVMTEILAAGPRAEQEALPGMASFGDLHDAWESSAATERESRSKFAQSGIRPEEVAEVLEEIRASLGGPGEVEEFTRTALHLLGAPLADRTDGFAATTAPLPAGLRNALPIGHAEPLPFRRDLPADRRHAHLDRTDPAVQAVARYVLDSALDDTAPPPRPARRGGAMVTRGVSRRTTLLLVRFRLDVVLPGRGASRTLVAEEAGMLAFRGRPTEPEWLSDDEVAALLEAEPAANIAPEQARDDVRRAVERLDPLTPALDARADELADRLAEQHRRVRQAARRAAGVEVRAHKPADVLGVYVYLPQAAMGDAR